MTGKSVSIKDVIQESHPNSKKALLNRVNDVNEIVDSEGNNALFYLFYYPSLIALCLEKGINVNNKNKQGVTSLMEMVSFNGLGASHIKSIKLIISHGADLAAQDKSGETALGHAILSQNYEVAKLLVKAGIDPNLTNNTGFSILEEIFNWKRMDDEEAYQIACIIGKSDKLKKNTIELAYQKALLYKMQKTAKCLLKLL